MRMFIEGCFLNPPNRFLCSKAQCEGVGDACNRETGGTSTGTRLNALLSQIDTCKEDETSLCIPMRPTYELFNGTQLNLLYCYKSVACIFTWGRETPTHTFTHIWTFYVFTFLSLLFILTFCAFHTCCSFLMFDAFNMHACLANGVNNVILLKHFHFSMCCLHVSCFHTPDVDALVVKVFS